VDGRGDFTRKILVAIAASAITKSIAAVLMERSVLVAARRMEFNCCACINPSRFYYADFLQC